MPKLMTVKSNQQVSKMLEKQAKAEGRTKTEILRRTLGQYSYLDKEMAGHEDEIPRVATDSTADIPPQKGAE